MKITKITINNLASIAGEHVIDFEKEPLKSAGIFAISGPTGSGKSTILDALCLALYDKMPRFVQSVGRTRIDDGENADVSQNDVRNILRRGCGSGYSEVEFISDDNISYASRWSVHRSRNNPSGNLQAQVIQITNLDTNTQLQGTKKELLDQLERLVGLTYDQFTRTVLLAQNDFATFLKSDEGAKAELLEKLTGTQIYSDISKKIYEISKAKNDEVTQVKNSIDSIETLVDEKLEELSKQSVRVEKKLHDNRKELSGLSQLDDLFKNLSKSKIDLSNKEVLLSNQIKTLEKYIKEEKDHDEVTLQFNKERQNINPQLANAVRLDALIVEKRKRVAEIKEKLKLVEHNKKEIKAKLEQSKSKKDKTLNDLKELYESLELPSDMERKRSSVNSYLEEQKQKFRFKYNKLIEEKEKLQIQKIYQKQKELEKRRVLLNELKTDFILYKENQRELLDLDKEVIKDLNRKEELNLRKEELEKKLPSSRTQLEVLKGLYEKAQRRVNKDVESIRNSLTENDSCPVCGSTVHKLTTQLAHSEYSIIKEDYEKHQKETNKDETDLKIYLNDLKSLKDILAKSKSKISNLKSKEESLKQKYIDNQFNNDYIVSEEKDISTLAKSYSDKVTLSEQQQKAIDKYTSIIHSLNDKHDRLHKLLDIYRDIEGKYQILVKDYTDACTLYKEKEDELKSESMKLAEQQSSRSKLLNGLSVEEFQKQIELKVNKLEEIKENLLKDKTKVLNEKSNLEGQISQIKEHIATIKEKVKEHTHDGVKEKIETLTKEIDSLDKDFTLIKTMLKTDEINREKKEKLNRAYQNLVNAAEGWSKLNSFLGQADGSKFKVLAQSFTLRILILHANEHLKYLAPRYRLEQIGDDLALKVIDQDMCDAERTVFSLSGGESFLISLALALGLSSFSNSSNLKVDSLFIDEGFGSLDAESLRTAMEALEQLQMQGRKIGVISHVQEMSERIAVQIQLIKEANGKSRILVL